MPHPLDEYPIHQAPVSMRYFDTSDRNVYDRCIMHLVSDDGSLQFAHGLGVYSHLGVIDAYVTARAGDELVSTRASGALHDDRLDQRVGPIRLEVVRPLEELRVVCDGPADGVQCDLTFTAAFPAIDEALHKRRRGNHLILEGCRFAQSGRWDGTIVTGGVEHEVRGLTGVRDRSWGTRPSGQADPVGRWTPQPGEGTWWCWIPLRFDDFFLMFVLEEDPNGFRTINDAYRVWPASSGRPVEQFGFPEVQITYRSGTRYPVRAELALRGRDGSTHSLVVDTQGPMPLGLGCGYNLGGEGWAHGKWMGESWVDAERHDLADPSVLAQIGRGMIDHAARAVFDGTHVGHGIFEHLAAGTHRPSGFTDHTVMAP